MKKDSTYSEAGVDIHAGEEAVASIKELARLTFDANVLGDLGSFGALYRFHRPDLQDPVLVASTDGVGTKLLVAIKAGRYDTIGRDLVNHCVNDILAQGAEPLFFLDYIGMGKLRPQTVKDLVRGMAEACRENGCALIGGEMAEMPGIYAEKDFDLVGTIVGVVERARILPGNRVQAGDLLVGLPSSGLHTNGYSLVRKIAFERLGLSVDSYVPELQSTLGEALLAVHRSYLGAFRPFFGNEGLHALAHITGGGIPGNLKRVIPSGFTARVSHPAGAYPPLFRWLQNAGQLSRESMEETFNLGIGLIAVIAPDLAETFCSKAGAKTLGSVDAAKPGEGRVLITD